MSNSIKAFKYHMQKVFKSETVSSKSCTTDQIKRSAHSLSPDPLLPNLPLCPTEAPNLEISNEGEATSSTKGNQNHSHRPDLPCDRKHPLKSSEIGAPALKVQKLNSNASRETSTRTSIIKSSSSTSHGDRQSLARSSRITEEVEASSQLGTTLSYDRESITKGSSPSISPSHRSRGRTGKSSRPQYITPVRTAAEDRIRQVVVRRLAKISGLPVEVVNEVDGSCLPLSFNFIDGCVIREGVEKADKGFMSGCNCRPENGRHVGCEYTSCECLEFANAREHGRKQFPYYCTGPKTGCLRSTYLDSRDAIFECNEFCNCGPECKNRNVQKGRQIPLEIFRTSKRGWGLRCPEPLRAGQFVDIYKGEIITCREADQRESRVENVKDSYLYTLDKFVGEENSLKAADAYIVDGEYLGGPTRFMNHSCQPNCRQFTVSYNHGDLRVYDLTFFTIREIPAGTELTFDYLDKDADDDDEDTQVKASDRKGEKGEVRPTECLCGAKKCRKWLWM
ncbi:MAG: hypothetical protein M1836_003116 [Candelina mexicana]|nr:MAG: hypothetical protein M1836_003116 [Candelina mexicana]